MNRPAIPTATAARANTGTCSRWPPLLSPCPPGNCTPPKRPKAPSTKTSAYSLSPLAQPRPAANAASEAMSSGTPLQSSSAVSSVADTWAAALAAHERSTDTLTRETRDALAAFAARFEAGAAALLATLKDSHAALQGELAAADTQRLAARMAQDVFVSFDYDHDARLKDLLIGQARLPDP
mgnify:CR=1 FL=1